MTERLEELDTDLIETRIRNLDQVYFYVDDEDNRRRIILTIDELKLELIRRGKYGRTCKQNRTVAS